MIAPLQPGSDDPRLILREEELDGGLELILLAEAALWAAGAESDGDGVAVASQGHLLVGVRAGRGRCCRDVQVRPAMAAAVRAPFRAMRRDRSSARVPSGLGLPVSDGIPFFAPCL